VLQARCRAQATSLEHIRLSHKSFRFSRDGASTRIIWRQLRLADNFGLMLNQSAFA